ncbi:hypothetical protein K437DRAFT_22525 [Tilletiaria anomala UBC 951]|uniref:Uncharacterized protein n=1 Tax=Tilletiaria anomala (strain ATCC 24038 / CBS 436.72 / UBC 951) TaxID=1037660 RepID=A0A066VAR5_TILAU|nr:uncharacterized protein K437DRAFT_22525 [Tilletiaria anomala UBC 951]KDN38576.1 hypothetical protein K437DRAFT_22525 [Tilletiaria anomala UBC 951]
MFGTALRTFTARSTLRAPPPSGSILTSVSISNVKPSPTIARPKRVAMMPLSSAFIQEHHSGGERSMASDEPQLPSSSADASPLPEGLTAGSLSATGKVSKFYD